MTRYALSRLEPVELASTWSDYSVIAPVSVVLKTFDIREIFLCLRRVLSLALTISLSFGQFERGFFHCAAEPSSFVTVR